MCVVYVCYIVKEFSDLFNVVFVCTFKLSLEYVTTKINNQEIKYT